MTPDPLEMAGWGEGETERRPKRPEWQALVDALNEERRLLRAWWRQR